MPVFRFADDWDKTDTLPSGRVVPNHESSLGKDEMQALVLLTLTIPGMDAPPAEMNGDIKAMAERLASADGKIVIKKGVHQRETDVHFTINLDPEPAGGYHVWLEAGDAVAVPTAPIIWGPSKGKTANVSLFKYKPTGISFRKAGIDYKWPAAFVISQGNMGLGRARGKSFSLGNSAVVGSVPPTMAQIVGMNA